MNEKKLAIDMTPEELDQWIDSLETEDEGIPEYYFSNPDPYFKIQLSAEPKPRNFWFDEDGNIHVKNISAYWIPEVTLTEEIDGTIYTVTGSYEGEGYFLRKLERISAKKFAESLEDHE